MLGGGHSDALVVGFTGSFGSGCTYIAKGIVESRRGYGYFSLSENLRQEYRDRHGTDARTRHDLQDLGDKIRESSPSFLADKVITEIQKTNPAQRSRFVVDSLRNPAEIRAFSRAFRRFFLFGVFASREVRWERTQCAYDNNMARFDEDDIRDTGEESPRHGQRVGDCFYGADIVVKNEERIDVVGNEAFDRLAGRVNEYLELVEMPLSRAAPKRKEEAIMAMAYAASQQSSCLKRKVGAVVVDEWGNAISSGYNEVPVSARPCFLQYTRCYREHKRDEFTESLIDELPELNAYREQIRAHVSKELKVLDHCRALHAEENAIVNIARHGSSVPLDKCTLYTTTYPCKLCANKILNVGIKRVVFLEPYPDEESKALLENYGIECVFFEGVTFNAYFRLYGEER